MTRTPTQYRTGRLVVGTVLAAGALLLSGCGGGGSSSPASSDSMGSMSMGSSPMSGSTGGTTSGARATVIIKNFAFSGPSSVGPGAQVTVTNDDSEAHTFTADGAGGFDVKVDPGASATFTAPMKPGSYPYHCSFHSNMHGTLEVK